jgi:predicted permease
MGFVFEGAAVNFRPILIRLRNFFGSSTTFERELDAELSSHLQLHVDDNLRRGLRPDEARRQALLQLGGLEQTKERIRDQRSLPFFEVLFQDARYAFRVLRKSSTFTLVSALTLALGIGANTAIFSLVDNILLRPLPYPQPQNLVSLTGTYPKGGFVALRDQINSFNVAAYYEGHEFNLNRRGEPLRLSVTLVSAEFFQVLGVHPFLGSAFNPGDDKPGQDNLVILSHELWQQQFASNPSIIGRSIELDGVSRQVVGVMPADFRFPSVKTQAWIPLHNDPRDTISYWASDFLPIIGRLQPDTSIPQAHAELRQFQSGVVKLFPWPMPSDWNKDIGVVELKHNMVSDVRSRLVLLLGAVALILLIACVNVANLALSRSSTREKEIAVRFAMGADRRRVIRQLLTESVLLALLGGFFGFLLATQGLHVLKVTLPADTPRLADAHIDLRVLAFTGLLALVTGLLFGLAPALQSSREDLAAALNSVTRGAFASVSHRLRSGLAIAEIAFAVLLVISAGLVLRSFWSLSHVDPGFRTTRILSARITPNQSFCADPARCISFYNDLLGRIHAIPGVNSVAVVNTLPLGGRVAKRVFEIEHQTPAPGDVSPLVWMDVITPDYLDLMNIPVAAGRGFTSADLSGKSLVVLVSASTARRYWPNQGVIGTHIRLSGSAKGKEEWRTIVGVVPDVRAYDLQHPVPDWMHGTIYLPYNESATLEGGRVPAEMSLVVQTALDESQLQNALRRTISTLGADIPVTELKPMQAVVSDSVSTPASTTILFLTFAGLAVSLGAIGIYGVLAFLVSTRTQEFGIRMSLGALPSDVLWLIFKDASRFALAGITLGLVSALAITRLLSSELYGVSPDDPFTFLGAALLMTIVTFFACYIPARRAMRVDPMIALRYE